MNKLFERYLADEAATEQLGAELARQLAPGQIVFLEGQLGAGKTTLVRAMLRTLGHTGKVKSPTYTLIEPYTLPIGPIYHLDLYRLGDPEELEYIGLRDLLDTSSILLVEWPERGRACLPEPDFTIQLEYQAPGQIPCQKPGRVCRITVESASSELQ